MTKIDYVMVKGGFVTVKYKSGRVLVYGRGNPGVVMPKTVERFIEESRKQGFMYCNGDTRAFFRNWER